MIALLFAAAVANPILSVEGPFEPTIQCPPDAIYHWAKTGKAATYALWAIPVNDWAVIGPYQAVTYHVGDIAIIYARTSIAQSSSYLFRHEACHAAGWTHEETRGVAPMGAPQ